MPIIVGMMGDGTAVVLILGSGVERSPGDGECWDADSPAAFPAWAYDTALADHPQCPTTVREAARAQREARLAMEVPRV